MFGGGADGRARREGSVGVHACVLYQVHRAVVRAAASVSDMSGGGRSLGRALGDNKYNE